MTLRKVHEVWGIFPAVGCPSTPLPADLRQVIRMLHPLEDEAEGLKKSLLPHLIRDVAEEEPEGFFNRPSGCLRHGGENYWYVEYNQLKPPRGVSRRISED